MTSGPFHSGTGPSPAAAAPSPEGDAHLLSRFNERQDEAAFAELVRRHGSLVWGVCRRVLHDAHEAEDAFQATFLVLVRRATSITRPELLANWLYGVAYRTAMHARSAAARRHAHERELTDMSMPEPPPEVIWQELRPLLDAELNRLPDRYRAPLVLCYLEGKTTEEAAQIMGCPRGTVMSRLARARDRLRDRLSRRGLTLSVGLFTTVLSQHTASAAPVGLAGATVKAAVLFAAGKAVWASAVSASVLALVQAVLKTVALGRFVQVLLRWLLVLCAVAGGGWFLASMMFLGTMRDGPGRRTRHEMSQLDAALQSFKVKYGFYPPSRIRLREIYTEYNIPGNPSGTVDPLDVDSVYYLTKMFPRIVDTWAGNPANGLEPATGVLPGMDWNLNGQIDKGVNLVLEGDQCLVFFLGGLGIIDPNTDEPSLAGWSTDVSNPIKIAVAKLRLGFANQNPTLVPQVIGDRNKFYDFDSKRLVYLYQTPDRSNHATSNAPPSYQSAPGSPPLGPRTFLLHPNYLPTNEPANQGFPFMSYADHFGTCDGQGTVVLNSALRPNPSNPVSQPGGVYAYFSSYKKANGYNRYFGYSVNGQATYFSDCQMLGVWPYAHGNQPNLGFPNLRYLNSTTYQIISSGRDTIFGSGTSPWAAQAGMWFAGPTSRAYADITAPPSPDPQLPPNLPRSTNYPRAGADDLADFADKPLGEKP
jgi:RNA polymerase sigma factor (sigma-70 family)